MSVADRAMLLGALFVRATRVWHGASPRCSSRAAGAPSRLGAAVAPLPAAAARRCSRSRAPARDRRLERALARLVGRARPLVGGAEPDARLPRASSPSGCSSARRDLARLGAPPRHSTVALGAAVVWALAGKAIPALVPGRRPRRPAARPDRLLERARARRRHAARARPGARGVRRAAAALRAAGAVLAYAAVVALLLAASRAGVAAAVLGRRALALAPARSGGVGAARARRGRCRERRSPPGRSRGRRSSTTAVRMPTASPTAPGSGCSWSWAPSLVALGARELARRPLARRRGVRSRSCLRGFAVGVAVVAAVALVAERGPDRGRVPRRGGRATTPAGSPA